MADEAPEKVEPQAIKTNIEEIEEKPLTPQKITYSWADRKCYGKSYYSSSNDALSYSHPQDKT